LLAASSSLVPICKEPTQVVLSELLRVQRHDDAMGQKEKLNEGGMESGFDFFPETKYGTAL
jgi:hypothetical protein